MTVGVALALVAALPFALGDWWSRLRHEARVERVCKPATLALLLGAAVVLDPASGEGARRWWFVAALAWSLVGDVALMFPRRFVEGLAAFLVAHLCYVAGFWTHGPGAVALAVSAVVVVAAVAPVAARVLRAVRRGTDAALAVPVATYMVVISAMLTSALASGNPSAAAGAVLFAASDSLIAWDRFVGPQRWAPVVIMVTYHAGQALLVLSLLD